MARSVRWTSADLELLPDDGKRYEIIDGELYVSRQPQWNHQTASVRIASSLDRWSVQTGAGAATIAPGVIFSDDDDVAPDVAWVSRDRLVATLQPSGHLHGTPELVVEVLSPGLANERRDREVKLKLYSRRGVLEYWIVDWRLRQIEVYRSDEGVLRLIATLSDADVLESPLLPGFRLPLAELFTGLS